MAHIFEDRVAESTTTGGTGAITPAGALTGCRTFASVASTGDTFWYAMQAVDGSGNPNGDYEEGLGTLAAGPTITRTTIIRSSNANAAVSWASGTTKHIAIALLGTGLRALQADASLCVPMPAASGEPSAPASGLVLYAKEIVPGHTVLKTKRPSGVDSPVQDALAFNRSIRFQGNGTAMIAVGAAPLTASAAGTAVTPASGSCKSQQQRIQYATAATAGALHTLISPSDGNSHMLRGNVQGEGGFRWVERFALNALQSGNRFFFGAAASRTAGTNVDPLSVAAPARVGLGINASTGNWFLCWSDGTTAGSSDLGSSFPVDTTSWMEIVLFCRPHNGTSAGNIAWRVRRYTTNSDAAAAESTGTLSSNQPAATTLLHPWAFFTNNATAAACSWHFGNGSLDSDW